METWSKYEEQLPIVLTLFSAGLRALEESSSDRAIPKATLGGAGEHEFRCRRHHGAPRGFEALVSWENRAGCGGHRL